MGSIIQRIIGISRQEATQADMISYRAPDQATISHMDLHAALILFTPKDFMRTLGCPITTLTISQICHFNLDRDLAIVST